MSLEQTIKDTVMAESVDLDMRLQQLVRAGLMPSNTIPLLRKAITKIQGGYPLQGAERDVMANFLNSMMFIVLGDDSIFNKARVGAKSYATESKEKSDMPFEGPYRKSGERKDEYGNKVKNVAKHLAKKAMRANEDVEEIEEKRGLWDNIHAKRKRIKAGSGERMRKPGSEGAPSAADLKNSRTEEVELDEATYFVHTANNAHHVNKKIPTGKKDAHGQALMTSKIVKSFPYGDTQSKQTSPDQHTAAHAHAKKLNASMKEGVETIDEISSDMAYRYLKGKRERDYDISADGKSSKLKKPMTYAKMNKDAKSSIRALRTIEKAKKANEEKESRRGEALADIAAITQMNESYKTTFNAALTQYGIKSPSELDEEKRKEFFNFVDQNYKQGDN